MGSQKYQIIVYWSEAEFGFRYSVYDSNGTEVLKSKDAFWYEENARNAAEAEVKKLK